MNELTDDEIRIKIAEWVGWHNIQWLSGDRVGTPPAPSGGMWIPLPDYLTDLNAVAQVEAEIERRGLNELYAEQVKRLVSGYNSMAFFVRDGRGWYDDMEFKFITVTARQRCEAILRVIESQSGAGSVER